MSLTPGTRLGVYEITAAIGEGGMGQVFRARDTKLDRDVAIKILPEAFAHDADRLARFTREAKVLASLNHPHIAGIHGLEESNGVTALVMELVEGDDLSQRITRGAIPIDEALPIAKQIAEALEAAHEQGIIHRDLKPANIKVRADGTVKVLDFGLAKAMDPPAGSSPNVSQSPTITTPAMTQAGMILGTAAYMAPEQARGKVVDKRADIWAFGAVLFEMLTGARAFGGEDVAETLANVINKEPVWEALPAMVPAHVRQALRLCLKKAPRERVPDIGAVRLALDGAFETAAPQAAATASASRGRVWMAAFAVAVSGMVAMALPAVRHLRETPPPVPFETRLAITTPANADPTSFALSPDGRQIVFVASDDGHSRLWLRSLAGTTAQPLAGTDGALYPFWSPDGRSVAFFADNWLKRLDLNGSQPPVELVRTSAHGGTWNADGVIVYGRVLGPLRRVSASGGSAAAVTTLDGESASHRFPWFLPDGRRFLFLAPGPSRGIYLGELDGSAPTLLTPSDGAGVFLPAGSGPADVAREDGWLLWARAGTLVAQRLDLQRKALVGAPVTLSDSVPVDTNWASGVSASAAGPIAYRAGGASRRQLEWFDRSGTPLGTLGAPDDQDLSGPVLSPDGRQVAVVRRVQGNQDIWLLDGSRMTRLTFDPSPDIYPVWSRDGRWVVFSSNRKEGAARPSAGGAGPNIYRKLSNGAGAEELLLESPEDKLNKLARSMSPDDRFLLYGGLANGAPEPSRFEVWALPMVGTRTPSLVLKSGIHPQFSPDGRWVAYASGEIGRTEIYVRPFVPPDRAGSAAGVGAAQWQVSTEGGIFPVWRRDGTELYYLSPSGAMMAAPVRVTGDSLAPGAPRVLFPTRIYGGGVNISQGRQYDVAPDGRFLINTVLDEATASITLIQHWNPEARK